MQKLNRQDLGTYLMEEQRKVWRCDDIMVFPGECINIRRIRQIKGVGKLGVRFKV